MQISEILVEARTKGIAIGAFNILNELTARAVILAADQMELPVILQTSTTTVKKLGIGELGGMLRALKALSQYPVLVHLDHCREQELARKCLDGDWDSVMIDGSYMPMMENIRFTREIAEYAHSIGKQVEGELGIIGGVEEDIAHEKGEEVGIDECLYYMEESKVDLFAPAIGTAHGVYHGVPVLNLDLVKELAAKSQIPLVVHGGTGLSGADFQKLIAYGASKINISTAIKQSYLKGLRENCGLSNPLDVDEAVMNEVKETSVSHLKLFSSSRVCK